MRRVKQVSKGDYEALLEVSDRLELDDDGGDVDSVHHYDGDGDDVLRQCVARHSTLER